MRRFQIHLDRWVLVTVKLRPIKSTMNLPLKIVELFQFQNFLTVFNGCWSQCMTDRTCNILLSFAGITTSYCFVQI